MVNKTTLRGNKTDGRSTIKNISGHAFGRDFSHRVLLCGVVKGNGTVVRIPVSVLDESQDKGRQIKLNTYDHKA